ncbi:MAG: dihydrolipoamide acetyltransferase family protein [Sphaerochaetaceae bacterium]|jgi:pyruvate dehydrogenase E2 component (dihydrolipoamide acetyltransferase)|nr:2-oxo acid dehydrogenase subunit E2 [Sphaerochaetaceae bacterium]NLO60993.1 2-oxo acid dehydrogenase subunit E2 [Spirochaetales bacterium]MDD2406124.1 dihydrolipoamide acetyltransferase family protein [Sphaerochaetaceae bacterium]MDD3671683.1 dihydrolipoamide acetyltransferase family protein [Sphaerochaetaceae bacterium]MDD4259789.1 dihydrolipoamide acetyltransferase family protein [Sphaerochaetaceae bacterium]
MAKEILMPKQGNSVESCLILEWKKAEGDSIAIGEIICEAETDKSTIEVESNVEGTILKLLWEAGDEVAVQRAIAIVGEPGEKIDVSSEKSEQTTSKQPEPAKEEPTVEVIQTKPVRFNSESLASPRAKATAEAKGIDYLVLEGSGPKGRIIERDVVKAAEGRQPVTRAAFEAAKAANIAIPSIGSGIGQRVVLSDIHSDTTVRTTESLSIQFPGEFEDTPVKGVRKVIAKRMYESLTSTAQLTMDATADATALKSIREKFKTSDPELGLQNITINDLILFAVSRTLLQFGSMNSHFLGEKTRQFRHVHLGCAVDTPKGLMVPVIRYADKLSLKEISNTFKALAAAAIEGKASTDDLSGGTFTVTNLGSLGIEHFTPVLNPPEVGILGVGSIKLQPVEDKNDQVRFIPHIGLSLTIDHQAIDGAPGARFLNMLCKNIASIDLLLAL